MCTWSSCCECKVAALAHHVTRVNCKKNRLSEVLSLRPFSMNSLYAQPFNVQISTLGSTLVWLSTNRHSRLYTLCAARTLLTRWHRSGTRLDTLYFIQTQHSAASVLYVPYAPRRNGSLIDACYVHSMFSHPVRHGRLTVTAWPSVPRAAASCASSCLPSRAARASSPPRR